ncbi:S-layer family protein [Thalassospira sp. TSL5-1]|uniref:beta strand repeat-containing protein n=1 Tax=Thalassospira sp. TSL5-1 TaxID=1544451 RepID=UPI00093ECC58|nr:filamentous hemagglutinin N-terminal domain-containing protein [Thalassospira sp. TSL5-1]
MSKNSFTNPSRRPLKTAAKRAALSHPQAGEAMAPARKRQAKGLTPFNILAGATALGSFFYATAHPAQAQSALPQGGTVVGGNVTIGQSSPDTMNVVQGSNSAIVNWQSFNVGSGNTVNFQQPSASSVILNRVVGNDPSAIFGTITANGTVMLVNPNGVVFGPGSRVDVGSLVATTANIRDADFMAGNYNFDIASADPSASIINAGNISIRDAGLAALVAPNVQNAGVINARLGKVSLGGAKTFSLDFHGDGLLSFGVSADVDTAPVGQDGVQVASLVSNSGSIIADGGVVAISARAVKDVIDNVINTQGVIQANSVSTSNGRIVLSGGDNGAVVAGGSLKVTGNDAGETGGSIVATGDKIAVSADAEIDASGKSGGGLVAIGSEGDGENGRGTGAWSNDVSIAKNASLKADAIENGNGGNVTVLSENLTDFGGSISAKGGAEGGNGGFAEVSSHKGVKLTGSVDLTALNGDTGTFLLDPDSLTIVAGSGGSLDGNAGDGSVGGSDANSGANTISASVLEGIAGTSNIILEATGLITVDTSLSLQTASGHSFTLKSTGLGGITFTDATDSISTNGGDIVLQATSPGANITNIANLNSNGGAIVIQAARDVEFAGNVNAVAGNITVNSVAGSIYNKSGLQTAPVLIGQNLTITTGTGNIGAADNAISTDVTGLTVEAGGSFAISNNQALASLNLSLDHLLSASDQTYKLNASGQTFTLSDSTDAYVIETVEAAGLNFTFSGEKNITIGAVDVGSGDVSLTANSGALYGAGSSENPHVTAGKFAISVRDGVTGNNASRSLTTKISSLSATTESGGLYISNQQPDNGGLTVTSFEAAGGSELVDGKTLGSSLSSDGIITLGKVVVGSGTVLIKAGSHLVDDGSDATPVSVEKAWLVSETGFIGTESRDLKIDSTAFDVSAAGDINLEVVPTSGTVTFDDLSSANGKIDLTTHTSTTITSASTSDANNIDITVDSSSEGNNAAALAITSLVAGTSGDVTLNLANGYVTASSLTADDLVVSATVVAGGASTNTLNTTVNTVDITTLGSSGSLQLTNSKAFTAKNVKTGDSTNTVSIKAASGNLTVATIDTKADLTLSANAGDILAVDANNNIRAASISLAAQGNLGASGADLKTYVTKLAVDNAANIYIHNIDNTLTSLSITNKHDANQANVVQLSSEHLDFDVTDDGSAVSLNKIIGNNLTEFAYTSDSSLIIGQVATNNATVALTAGGNISDDGDTNTRLVTGGTLSLFAESGSIGKSAAYLEVIANDLTINAGSDIYLRNISDMYNLNIKLGHADPQQANVYDIEAQGFELSLTNSLEDGYALDNLFDVSGMDVSLDVDDDLTLGNIDVTYSGSISLASDGAIVNDNVDSNYILANSISLNADAAIGAADKKLDILTGNLSATAQGGGIYIASENPTGSSNYDATLKITSMSAQGDIDVALANGDVALEGSINTNHHDFNLATNNGAVIGSSSGSVNAGSGKITIESKGNIGRDSDGDYTKVFSLNAANVDLQAGGTILTSGSHASTILTMSAGGASAAYTLTSGNLGTGNISVANGAGTLALTATGGAIYKEVYPSTLQAAKVTLDASGVITSLETTATDLTLKAGSSIDISATSVLTDLSIEATSTHYISVSSSSLTFSTDYDNGLDAFVVANLNNQNHNADLNFSLNLANNIRLDALDVRNGSISITSGGSIFNDGNSTTVVKAAGGVTLSAGANGHIGAENNALDLDTSSLTVTSAGDIRVASATALTHLAVTSTNASSQGDLVFDFGVNAPVSITDGASSLTVESTESLSDFSLISAKNIIAKNITATGTVSLETTATGSNSNISNFDANTVVNAAKVVLKTNASSKTDGAIGASGTALKLETSDLSITTKGSFWVNNSGSSLQALTLDLAHVDDQTSTRQTYSLSGSNNAGLTLSDTGSQVALSLATSSAIDFTLSIDRQISTGTIDAGTSSTGAVSLTTTGQASGQNEHGSITRSSGTITAGYVTLNSYESVSATTNTQNLSIDSSFNVNVINSATLDSLKLNVDRKNVDSGQSSSDITYSISSSGLTFSSVVNKSTGIDGFSLGSISQSGLDLDITADKTITVGSVNVGSSGNLTLTATNADIRATTSNQVITAGELTLNANQVYRYGSSDYFHVDAQKLSGTVKTSARISDNGGLTVSNFAATEDSSSIDLEVTNGDLLTEGERAISARNVQLVVKQGDIGANGNSIQSDARNLTLVGGGNIFVANAADLFSLDVTANHHTNPNYSYAIETLESNASLSLSIVDDPNATMQVMNLADKTGIDFSFSSDKDVSVGTLNAGAGRWLSISATGTAHNISAFGTSSLIARSISLNATNSIGATGAQDDGTTRIQTTAKQLSLSTGSDIYVDNHLDLASFSIKSEHIAQTNPTYIVTAPELTFLMSDSAMTNLTTVIDNTGLVFSINSTRGLYIGTINTSLTGSVTLETNNSSFGIYGNDLSKPVVAGAVKIVTRENAAVGKDGWGSLVVSAATLELDTTGSVYLFDTRRLSQLSLTTRTGASGTYKITDLTSNPDGQAQDFDLAAHAILSGSADANNGSTYDSITDNTGLALSIVGDNDVTIKDIDLAGVGQVSVSNIDSGNIYGDGINGTAVNAAVVRLYSSTGSIGGTGTEIEIKGGTVTASAKNDVSLALQGRTDLGTINISGTGKATVVNTSGDIALGTVSLNGNDFYLDNQGGSILSGTLNDTGNVTLIANGSIGSQSAIQMSANGSGTTTLLQITAVANDGTGTGSVADGSVNITESYGLIVGNVSAASDVTISGGTSSGSSQSVTIDDIVAGTGAVTITAGYGSVLASGGGSSITAGKLSISASRGSIGASGAGISTNATKLDLKSPRNIYVSSDSDLTSLSIDRTNSINNSYDSSGSLSISAQNLTFAVSDGSSLTTLTQIEDTTGLDLTYKSIESLRIGSIDVGSGNVTLSASYSSAISNDQTTANITSINSSSLLKAGSLSLTASNSDSAIGSGGQALMLDVDALVATAGTGGMNVNNAHDLALNGISTSGDLAITIASGNLTVDSLSYGTGKDLALTATHGSIFTGVGKSLSLSSGNITLNASDGIGSSTSRLQLSGSGTGQFTAHVTGEGDIYLNTQNGMSNKLVASTTDGSIDIVSDGDIRLTDLTVGKDAVGNNIIVNAKSGNITIGGNSGSTGVAAGANFGKVNLSAKNGAIYAGNANSSLGAFEVRLTGANGVGTQNNAIAASGQRVLVSATNAGADIYLRSAVDGTFSSVSSNGGDISISGSNGASILVASAVSAAGSSSTAGNITITTTGEGGNLILGAINAKGSSTDGKIVLSSENGSVLDDLIAETRIVGSTLEVNAASGVGSDANNLQTTVGQIIGTIATGNAYITDDNTNGVDLGTAQNALRLVNGSLFVNTGNAVDLVNVKAETDGNNITVIAATGDLTVGSVMAGATSFDPQNQPVSSKVTLKATEGSILSSGTGENPVLISGDLSLDAKQNIGAFDWQPGQTADIDALQVIVSSLAAATHTNGSVIAIFNQGAAAITLGNNITADGAVSIAVGSKGNVTWSDAFDNAVDKLYLTSGDVLTLDDTVTAGSIYVSGKNDIVSTSQTMPRTLKLEATTSNGIELHSGSAGGTTTVESTATALKASLAEVQDGNGSALVITNTGALTVATLSAYNNVTLTNNVGVSGANITTHGDGHTAEITATTGDIAVGTIDTGANGTINLTSTAGAIAFVDSQSSVTANILSLQSFAGIGTENQSFSTNVNTLNATVTGTGNIYTSYAANRSTGVLNAHDGDIFVTGLGDLDVVLNKIVLADGHKIVVNTGQSDVTLTGNYNGGNQTTSFDVTGATITTAAFTTGGSQTYKGTTILNGDLQASAISITGDVQARGTALSLISSNNGNITVTGSIEGTNANEDTSLTVNAGTGDVSIGSAKVKIASVDLTGANITVGDVTSSGSQTYNGAANLNGAYVAGGEFKVTGAALLTGNTNTIINTSSNNSNVTFGGTIDSTNTRGLEINSGFGAINFSGAIGGTNILQYLTLTTSVSQADLPTDGQIVFGTNANVKVVDDFKQVGGRRISLPVSIESELGNVEISGAAYLKAGATSIKAVNENEGGRVQFLSTVNGNATQLKVEASDRIEFVGDYTDAGVGSSVELIAPQMMVNAVSTKGAQSYTGQTTRITGDLTAGSILVDGNATLAAQIQMRGLPQIETTTFDTSAANGDITIKGTLDGNTDNVVMTAGTGAVAIEGAVTNSTSLTITGGTIALHDVTTDQDQTYTGTTTLNGTYQTDTDFTVDGGSFLAGDTVINTQSGSLLLKGAVNSVSHADLTLNLANTNTTVFDFALGNTSALGKLTINAGENGVTQFARTASISALDGLVYTGGIKLLLPANITAANGPITLGKLKLVEDTDLLDEIAVKPQSIDGVIATLPSGKVTIRSGDDITIAGLIGTSTDLVMTSGTGDIRIGSKEGTSDQKINVKSLNVAVAGTANLYGTIGGISGFDASYEIGPLKFAPYFINDAFWRNRELPPAATKTAPLPKPPSTPQVDTLFNLNAPTTGVTPNVIAAFAAPTVLNVGTTPVGIPATISPSVINTTGTGTGGGRVTVNPAGGTTGGGVSSGGGGFGSAGGGAFGTTGTGGAAGSGLGSGSGTGLGGGDNTGGTAPDGGSNSNGGNEPGVVGGQSSDSDLIQSNDQ